MTEMRLNDRRNWKAETFPYDHYIPDETRDCSVCLTEKQIEILLGIIEPLAWRTRWWSDIGTEIDRFAIEDFRADLTRRLMMGCCGDESPVIFRYTVEGVLQRSLDNGETWEDSPQNDIRTNAPQFPPIEGDDGEDKKCIAASGMVALIKEQIGDNLTDDMTRYTLSQLITDWVTTFLGTSNPFTALLTVVVNQIFALIIATLRPALTDDVYQDLLCIFNNNMGNDASFNDSQWSTVRSEITTKITGIAGVFLEHLVYLLGSMGLTNLARSSGATSGDCSECDTGCAPLYNITDGFGTIIDSGEHFVTVQSTYQTSPFGYNMARLRSTMGAGACCTMVNYEVLAGTAPSPTGGDDTFPANQGPISFPKDLCWIQFEQDGAESQFTVKINFL